jgi:plasmid stability protein
MDTTIRNLDPDLYRKLRSRAALNGQTIGEAVSAAMRAYLARPESAKTASLRDLVPEPFPPGNERLSEEVDAVVYGATRGRR